MNESIGKLNLDQFSSNPVARWFAFLIACCALVLINILFVYEVGGTPLVDRDLIIPFLLFTIVPASLSLKIGSHAICYIRACCIPIGLLVCCLSTVNLLSNVTGYQTIAIGQRLLYSPLAFGAIAFFLLKLIEPEDTEEVELEPKQILGLLSLTVLMLILTISFITEEATSAVAFYDIYALGFCGVITLVCFVYPEVPKIAAEGRLYRSSLVTILFFSIFGVSLYTLSVASGSQGQLTFSVSFTLFGIIYGALQGLFSISIGGQSALTTKDRSLYGWHMIEGYALFILIVLPPQSFWDLTN